LSKQTFTLRYLSKTAIGVPRDLAKTAIAQFRPIRPTVLIFNCTFVCDARCTMCSNWKRGNRKEDMTLAEIDGAMNHEFWGAVENLNISGGELGALVDYFSRVESPVYIVFFGDHLPSLPGVYSTRLERLWTRNSRVLPRIMKSRQSW
jgi:hypothetical protein